MSGQGAVVPPASPPPAERIDGAALLDRVREWLARFVAYPSPAALHSHAAWIAHTHVVDCFENTPRIAFLSPEPGSGKSRALEVTEPLVPAPLLTVNTTVSALFRSIGVQDGLPPTVLFDEVDTIFTRRVSEVNEELRGMLNSGYRRGADAIRSVVRGKTVEVERSPTFCPVALAGLDDLPDTLMTRAVVVRMRRRSPHERIEPYRRRVTRAEAEALHAELSAWAEQERPALLDAWPPLPESVTDRDADVWEPLIAVADAAGGAWPQRIRSAALELIAEQSKRPPTVGIRLLADIRTAFAGAQAMSTTMLLDALASMESAPWGGIIGGQPIDARYLARKLGKYDIPTNNTVRDGGSVYKGYRRSHFADAWARYLPAEAAAPPPDPPEDDSERLI